MSEKQNNESVKKAYALYCNDNFIYAYETREEAERALATRNYSKFQAARRIAEKDYEDCADPVTEFEFDQILASNEYEIEEIEIDRSEESGDVSYCIMRDDEEFLNFEDKTEAMEVFIKLYSEAISEMSERIEELKKSDFSKAFNNNFTFNKADAVLWELAEIPRYRIVPLSKDSSDNPYKA